MANKSSEYMRNYRARKKGGTFKDQRFTFNKKDVMRNGINNLKDGGDLNYNTFKSYLESLGFKPGKDEYERDVFAYQSPDYRKERFTGRYENNEPVMEKAQGYRIEVLHTEEDSKWSSRAPNIRYQYASAGNIVNGVGESRKSSQKEEVRR